MSYPVFYGLVAFLIVAAFFLDRALAGKYDDE